LTHIIARECNLEVGDYVHTIGDAHIYSNHFDQVKEQLNKSHFALPELQIDDSFSMKPMFDLDTVDKFTLNNYQHHAAIKAPMAV
jgi:thymidylate synthase